MNHRVVITSIAATFVIACGGAKGSSSAKPPMDKMTMMDDMMDHNMAMPADPDSEFGPMQDGADWATYTKVSSAPFPSPTHGGRDVEVWVNSIGLAAYESADAAMPVGSIIVKTSTDATDQDADGQPSPGPTFVMVKRAAGYAPDHNDWSYAIRWESPSPKWAAKLGGPIYWRTPSKKAAYCSECHDSYDRELGGVPDDKHAW